MTKHSLEIGESVVEYDENTGVFTWVHACRKPFLRGRRADREGANGYRYLKIGQRNWSASRLAYELAFGEIPDGLEIDHINRDNTDNRASNLRVVTREQNLANREFSKNQVGFVGVSLHSQSGLFRARHKGKVAYFETPEEAAEHYKKMKAESDKETFGGNVPPGSSSIQEPSDEPDFMDSDYYIPRSGLPR